MCACRRGSTCDYHKYSNWRQERKDAWNARRRLAYAKKVGKVNPHVSQDSPIQESVVEDSPMIHEDSLSVEEVENVGEVDSLVENVEQEEANEVEEEFTGEGLNDK